MQGKQITRRDGFRQPFFLSDSNRRHSVHSGAFLRLPVCGRRGAVVRRYERRRDRWNRCRARNGTSLAIRRDVAQEFRPWRGLRLGCATHGDRQCDARVARHFRPLQPDSGGGCQTPRFQTLADGIPRPQNREHAPCIVPAFIVPRSQNQRLHTLFSQQHDDPSRTITQSSNLAGTISRNTSGVSPACLGSSCGRDAHTP